MRKKLSFNPDEAPGQDSFLDVIANIVGILIILVMLVGAQTTDVIVKSIDDDAATAEPAAPPVDLETARRHASALGSSVEDLAKTAHRLRQEAMAKFQERGQLQLLVTSAQHVLKERRDELDETQQAEFDLRRQLESARVELEDLTASRVSVENSASEAKVIRHLPTPMAKTVFSEEEHFRLLNGRLAYVPINPLVEKLKQEAPLKLYKLKEAPQITETIGPHSGFSMKYTLHRTKIAVNTSQGTMVRDGVDLLGFVLVPARDDLGEPLEDALKDNSEFMNRLRAMDPHRTTITIWTYPDSFSHFRTVKESLFSKGFLTAGRPMPEGHPIGGSPKGSRSGAQ